MLRKDLRHRTNLKDGGEGGGLITVYQNPIIAAHRRNLGAPIGTTVIPPVIPTDPLFNDVLFLSRFDDPSNTGITYYGNFGGTVSLSGLVNTAPASPFGGNALSLPGGAYAQLLGDDLSWNFGSADFTIEFWFKLTTLGRYHSLIFRHNNAADLFPFYAQINSSNQLETVWRYNSAYHSINGGTALSANQWYFFKGGKEGGSVKVYLDNNLIGQSSVIGAMESLSAGDSKVFVGFYFDNTLSMIGQLSNLRITKNAFRTTTIPTLPFPLS